MKLWGRRLSVPRLRVTSIRSQLLLWLLIPIIALGVICSLVLYRTAIEFANDAYDDSLADSARTLASRLSFPEGGKLLLDLPPAARAILEQDDDDRFFYQVLGRNGKRIAGDPTFPPPPKTQKTLKFRNGWLHDEKVRIAILKVRPDEAYPEQVVTIQVAETYTGRKKLIHEILTSMVFLQVLYILLSAGSVWLGVTRGLEPLEKVRQAVAMRSPRDMSPLREASSPTEVRPLVHAINDLMVRVSDDIEMQRRFLANAAHQLRTPLAGLKTQTELALRTTHPDDLRHSFTHIQTSVERTVHLSQQLLSLTRAEPSVMDSTKFRAFDLGEVVRQVTRELVPQAIQKSVDLGYEGEIVPFSVLGEPLSVRELASNLIENAVRYTQHGGQVTVRIVSDEKYVNLIVEDNGPGIPKEDRSRVFERFYRVLGTGEDGSGLGLSIVQEIAETHQAEVTLKEGPGGKGTSARVRFPNAVQKTKNRIGSVQS